MTKEDKKKINSWAMYDWANSTYSTTVMAGFFPLFFKNYWSAGTDPVTTTARLGTAISIASLLIALVSPTLGVIADVKGSKKLFCMLFMLVGVGACGSMAFIPGGNWWYAIVAYGVAMMAYNASCVFYDSLLPFIAKGFDMDYASSLGYSVGYLGGGLMFTVNVLMVTHPEWFHLADKVQAVKVSFFMVAVWWFVFSYPLLKNVPEPEVAKSKHNIFRLTHSSIVTLMGTWKSLIRNKNLLMYMLAFWLYIDGVYTVMTMAVDFGLSLGLPSDDLIKALLITQYIGFPCAFLFGIVTKRFGCRKPILLCIGVYSIAVIAATQMSTATHFYLLALTIGMAQGGVQSLSRSLFAKMIKPEESGEYFGLFNLVGKFASILGPLLVAAGVYFSGNARWGMVGLLILFIIGGTLLWKVKEPTAAPH